MPGCPGCLRAGPERLCTPCERRLFDGVKVPIVLPFNRPAYNQARLQSPGQRLSISGVQTKMSLALEGTTLRVTERGGHYILKPIPKGEYAHLEQMPINEHLTMQLARQVFRLSVADCALVNFADGEPAYLVRRFDVRKDGTKNLQEDLAQVANRSQATHGINYKYDVSYEEVGELIRRSVSAYRVAAEQFFRLLVFNYLVRNEDAHLKNFSVSRKEESEPTTLTPAYDLLNTRLHVDSGSRTALDFFRDDFETPSYVANTYYARDDFRELARRLGLNPVRAERFLTDAVAKEPDAVALIERSSLSAECKSLYRAHLADSVKALSYSFAESRRP